MTAQPLGDLAALLERPDGDIDVAEAALRLTRLDVPELPVDRWLDRIDRFAAAATDELGAHLHPHERARQLCHYLHERHGFRGVGDSYYAYENSYLHRLLERGISIPITLAVLYIAVGRRAGLVMEGVNFPGHFLVRLVDARAPQLLDPFNGVLTTPGECAARLRLLQGEAATLQPEHLAAAGSRQIVLRMLNNLKGVALYHRRLEDALRYASFITSLLPEDLVQYRDRAVIHEQLGDFAAAARELDPILQAVEDPEQRQRIQRKIDELLRGAKPTIH